MHDYVLYLSYQQADAVKRACELYLRLHMGQWGELRWLAWGDFDREDADRRINNVKYLITGLKSHEQLATHQVPEHAQLAGDVFQVVRHKLAWDTHPEGGITVDFDRPMKMGSQPLPTIQQLSEAENVNT